MKDEEGKKESREKISRQRFFLIFLPALPFTRFFACGGP